MQNSPFHSIPDFPADLTATNTLARFIDGLGFRYHWATEGLTANEINFRPVDSSMNMEELLGHIFDLANWINWTFKGPEMTERPTSVEALRNETLDHLHAASERLKELDDTEFENFRGHFRNGKGEIEIWYFMNGPIADALTHVGQIASWRRIAGNPQPAGVNPFFGTKK